MRGQKKSPTLETLAPPPAPRQPRDLCRPRHGGAASPSNPDRLYWGGREESQPGGSHHDTCEDRPRPMSKQSDILRARLPARVSGLE